MYAVTYTDQEGNTTERQYIDYQDAASRWWGCVMKEIYLQVDMIDLDDGDLILRWVMPAGVPNQEHLKMKYMPPVYLTPKGE